MAHPLTPREKVAEEIVDRTGVGTLGLTYEASQSVALGIADAILTALASGSGDHAELARLAEGVIKGDDSLVAALRSLKAFHAAANPAAVLSLIAENAALRAECDGMVEEVSRSQARLSHLQKELDALIDSGADTQTNNGDDQ